MANFVWLWVVLMADAPSAVRTDETVVLFPTWGYRAAEGDGWVVPIHGWIFEAETDSRLRRATLGLFRRALGLEADQEETLLFRQRAGRFLVDNESGKLLQVRVGETEFLLQTPSGANGHFRETLQLTAAQVAAPPNVALRPLNLPTRVVLPAEDRRSFSGQVFLLADQGLSVVSDIDDTIKVSEVTNRQALLANTFLRPFRAVPGMAELYRKLADRGATFHYVSSSPWQLHGALTDFQQESGFPAGTMHLKLFRWKDSSFLELFSSPLESKPAAIEPLLEHFPHRRFVFIGDSGEKDPEVYGLMARKFPQQVVKILIRNVTDEAADAPRYRQAFEQVPSDRWQVFREPGDVELSP